MKTSILGLFIIILSAQWSFAQNASAEQEIIETGSIWHKQADVHDVVVKVFGETAILWNRITLVAMVRGNEANTEFTVTEVYQKQQGAWKLPDLTFSSEHYTHSIEH